MPSPRTASLAAAVTGLVEAHVAADPSAVARALADVKQPRRGIEPRRAVPFAMTVDVFCRDCWACRYCGNKTIAPPVLRTLSSLHPDEFPFHPNWKAGQVHPAYLLLSASLDHVHPIGRPGSSSEPDDLVTACWLLQQR